MLSELECNLNHERHTLHRIDYQLLLVIETHEQKCFFLVHHIFTGIDDKGIYKLYFCISYYVYQHNLKRYSKKDHYHKLNCSNIKLSRLRLHFNETAD